MKNNVDILEDICRNCGERIVLNEKLKFDGWYHYVGYGEDGKPDSIGSTVCNMYGKNLLDGIRAEPANGVAVVKETENNEK